MSGKKQKNSSGISVKIRSSIISGPLDNNFLITVIIKNHTDKNYINLIIEEKLLTQTNVYFSSLNVNNIPVEFTRNVLYPQLIKFGKISPREKIILTYPISVYPLINDTGNDQPNDDFVSEIKVTAQRKCKTVYVINSLLITSLPLMDFDKNTIGIAGAGLAGLTTAYRLSQAGYSVIIYEASDKIGGRCFSGKFPDGEVYEHGGELINTDQEDILDLISELGLQVINVRACEKPKSRDFYEVVNYDLNNGKGKCIKYYREQAANDFFNLINPNTGLSIYQQMVYDANYIYPVNEPEPGPATPWPLDYGGTPDSNAYAAELDKMNLDEYINNITSFLRSDGNGAKTKLGQFLKVAYVIEYGAEPCEQSSLNIIYLLGFLTLPSGVEPPNIPPNYFSPFGISDETYRTAGGNSNIVIGLLSKLQLLRVPIFLNNRLSMITTINGDHIDKYGNKPYQLTIVRNKTPVVMLPFKHVVSAIPFSVYNPNPKYNNWGIDITNSGFSPLKFYTIQHLAMARNSKLNVQFLNRFWNNLGSNGSTFATSNPYLCDPCGGDIVCPGSNIVQRPCPEHSSTSECTYTPSYNVSETKYQNTWDVSCALPQKRGILVDYTGGKNSEQFLTSDDIMDIEFKNKYLEKVTCEFLNQLNFLLPGATDTDNFIFEYSNGSIINVNSNNWLLSPYQRGSYPFWQSGQYIGGNGKLNPDGTVTPPCAIVPFAGYEGVPEPYTEKQTGNFHFAGDQTSYDNQGYLNGAVQSANRVYNEITKYFFPTLDRNLSEKYSFKQNKTTIRKYREKLKFMSASISQKLSNNSLNEK